MARLLPEPIARDDPQVRCLQDIGAAVRNARASGRLRIDDAAAFAGVSADMLSRLENGKPVTTDRLLKVLAGLGLEILIVPRADAMQLRSQARKADE
jgi:transcriptional regulator with XRE-family HTH domain